MSTTLRSPVQARAPTGPPGPWGVPRPDGPLAAALRDAQAQREVTPADTPPDIPAAVLPDLPDLTPREPPALPSTQALAEDIERLAREVRAQDGRREALALALEWPEEAGRGRRARPGWGWLALAGMVVLAGAAATVAVSMSSSEEAAGSPQVPLKLEKRLSLPR